MIRSGLYRGYAALRTRPLLSALASLEASQWLPAREQEARQLDRLRAILLHAGGTVPYYRDLFAARAFDPSRLRAVEELERLPLLTREILVERFDDLRSSAPGPGCFARATGGSTGRPLRFLSDRDDMTLRSAHIYRGLGWLGWRLGDRTAYVWGSDIDAKDHTGRVGRIRDRVAGVLWIDAFTLSQDRLDDVLERLRRFDPRVVIGYPSSLHLLASRALATGRLVPLRGVETSAEMLAPRVRDDLSRAFSATVLDRYGCREIGVIAHECPKRSMHINAEAAVVESVGGEMVVTALNNRSMPLIRYRNEDLGGPIEGRCSCGRGLPLLGPIRGRVSDVIRSPGGRLIHGEFFTHLFYQSEGVTQFQVRQSAPDLLEIRVVASGDLPASERERLERAIRDHADPAFRVRIVQVPAIPAGPSGKFRFVLSDPEAGPSAP